MKYGMRNAEYGIKKLQIADCRLQINCGRERPRSQEIHSAIRNPQLSCRGSVLILVLWIMIVLGILGLSYSASVRTQLQTARFARGRHTAQWAARSGVERAMAELARADLTVVTDQDPLLSDETTFLAQPVDDFAAYTLIGTPDAEGLPRFGLIDESSKISINRASEAMLTGLSGVTTEMAESLIDWRDANETPLTEGGESEYYQTLPMPYSAKNAAFDSVRELVRVKGWGPLFDQAMPDPYRRFAPPPAEGEALAVYTETAANTGQLNAPAPASEEPPAADGSAGLQPAASGQESQSSTPEGSATGGVSTGDALTPEDARAALDSLTAWSAAPTTNPDGTEKVNIASADAGALMAGIPGLTRDEADAMVTWRRNRPFRSPADLMLVTRPSGNNQGGPGGSRGSSGSSAGGSGRTSPGGLQEDPEDAPIGSAPKGQSSSGTMFSLSRVGEMIDYCSTRNSSRATDSGRININTAPRQVLLAIPGMTEELADEIIAEREGNGAIPNTGYLASMKSITATQFRQVYPWICTRSNRFRVFSHGVDADSGAAANVEAVLDMDALQQVTVVYWREF